MPDLDIVIVNWNTGRFLANCLDSLPAAVGNGVHLGSVCVVDNGSSDESMDVHPPRSLPVIEVRNPTNLGFAAASNLGASKGISEFILFLNPDTRLHPDSLSAPLRFLSDPANLRYGICGIQMVDEQGNPAPCVSRFPTATAFFYKALGLSEIFKVVCASVLLPAGYPRETCEVDQVIGAFMLVRRSLFSDLGGFDERFFVYFEDADLSLRAKQRGRSSYFLRQATAFHQGQGSSHKVRGLRLFYSLRSRLLYSKKHFSPIAQATTLILAILVEPLARMVKGTLSLSISGIAETAKGYLLLYRWLAGASTRGQGSRDR